MPLTRPIPTDAMPVVEILRRDVPRPKALPNCLYGALRWSDPTPGDVYAADCCPMGLHPHATVECPETVDEFLGEDDAQSDVLNVEPFFRWWDGLLESDAAAAVEAIWPSTEGGT